MTTTLQTRVDEELARAARERASERGVSVAAYISELVRQDIAAAEEAAFWQEFTDYYADPEHVAEAQAEAEQYAHTLTDGLDAEKDAG